MLALFLIWVCFNGRITLEVVLLGIGLVALTGILLHKAMDYTPKKELMFIRILPRVIAYLFALTGEVFKSNWAMVKIILSKDAKITSQLTFFTPGLNTQLARVALANSITLTPGTITVQLKDGRYCVHTVRDEFISGIADSALEDRLERIEGGHDNEQ